MFQTKPSKKFTDISSFIVQELRDYIRSNNLHPGDYLPAQSALAEMLGVSKVSLREALTRLETLGFIHQIHGVGTLLTRDPSLMQSTVDLRLNTTEMIRQLGKTPGTIGLHMSRGPAPLEIADLLITDPKSEFLHISRIRTADGVPFSYSDSYLVPRISNMDFNPEKYGESLYTFIQTNFGEAVNLIDVRIEVSSGDNEIGHLLNLPQNSPLLIVRELHYNQNKIPFASSIECYAQNIIKFEIKMNHFDF